MNKERVFTIFGGTGDLTFRKLLPAFYNMEAVNDEKGNGQIVIIGRRDYTGASYKARAEEWIRKFARVHFNEETFQKFAARILYYHMDFSDHTAYEALDAFYKEIGAREHIFYFAVDPRFFATIAYGLQTVSGAEMGKVVIEKPFGENLEAAEALNAAMEEFFKEDHIYHIDHYLGKEMVRNIQTIRFTNLIFNSIWDAHHIDCIQISATEEVGVETRGSYYDHSGAVKDMLQNHLLQILTVVAMEQPPVRQADLMHEEQMQVLKALRMPENIAGNMVLGQYEGYRGEPAVDPQSNTETYAAVKLFIDNDRWRGMPFFIRTGKKLKKREMQVAVVFKSPMPGMEPNILTIKIQPSEGMSLRFNIKRPGEAEDDNELKDIITEKMDFTQSLEDLDEMNTPEAYERLLGACVSGERSWFSQWDQIETCWNYVNTLKRMYYSSQLPIYSYQPGGDGPDAAADMLGEHEHCWYE